MNFWDLIILYVEFAYNASINHTTNKSPFEIIYGYPFRKLVDLIPMSKHIKILNDIESFTTHTKNLQEEIHHHIMHNNASYKQVIDSHYCFLTFEEGNLVMVRIRLKRFPFVHSVRPFLILKRIKDNAYIVGIPST